MPDYKQIKASLKEFILKRIAEHPANDPVKLIEFGYEYAQEGLFCVYFDTRPDAKPDGTWTVRLEGNSIEMPDWPECTDWWGGGFGTKLGKKIKELAFELREQGAFEKLPKQNPCEFGVEEMCGEYGWPDWEDRGKENLI